MPVDQVSHLSTMPHKLARDIRLSSDIGRDSPFDPFKGKDMTLMFGKKKDRGSASLVYFAQKPMRRAQGSVMIGRQSDPRKGGTSSQPKDTVNHSAYHPKFSQQDCPKTVGFTQGHRFQSPTYRDEFLEQRKQAILARRMPGDPAHPLIEGTEKDRSIAKVAVPEPKSLVVKPDPRRATSLSKQAGRGWDDLRPKTVDRSKRYTVFPWEKHLSKSRSEEPSGNETNKTQDHRDARPASAVLTGEASSNAEGTEKARARSAAPAGPTPAHGGTEEEEEETWLKERKNLLARAGLNGGGGRRERLRRRVKPKGVDFGSTTGRDAPVQGYITTPVYNEKLYMPKYEATGRERKKYADVKLDKYAGRKITEDASHIQTVNKVLTIPNLAKFHAAKLKAETQGALAMTNTAPPAAVTKKPLTGADDFATHPDSLHAPNMSVTRKFKGVPDLNMYSDRPDEPLEKILGGSRKKYERMFMKEDKEREMAAQQAALLAQHGHSM